MRYAKYALVGSIVAAVGASTFASGAAFVLAPPTLATSLGIGLIWAVGKWGFRKTRVGEKLGVNAVAEVKASQEGVKKDGSWMDVQGPRAVPW